MTVVVGVLCGDGVVIGTDSVATFVDGAGGRTVEQPMTHKVDTVGDRVLVAGTGEVGLGQRFAAVLEKSWEDREFTGAPLEVGKALSLKGIQDFQSTGVGPGSYGALVAFPCSNRPHLCEFQQTNFQPELKTDRMWYVSMGSGQRLADGFLAFMRDAFWGDEMPQLLEAVFAVTWTLEHVITCNTGGVGGPAQIAVLENTGRSQYRARLLGDSELDEHRERIASAKDALRDSLRVPTTDVPEAPRPETESDRSDHRTA